MHPINIFSPYFPKIHSNIVSPTTPRTCEWSPAFRFSNENIVRGCIQKFPDGPPGGRTANGTAFYHYGQLYRYSVSQSSEFYRHNPLCCISTRVYYCCCLFLYDSVRKLLDTISYTFLIHLMRATCPVHLILVDFITLLTLAEEYKLHPFPIA
jgi:hypothetical protein